MEDNLRLLFPEDFFLHFNKDQSLKLKKNPSLLLTRDAELFSWTARFSRSLWVTLGMGFTYRGHVQLAESQALEPLLRAVWLRYPEHRPILEPDLGAMQWELPCHLGRLERGVPIYVFHPECSFECRGSI